MAWIEKIRQVIWQTRGLVAAALLAAILAGASLTATALPRSQDYTCVSYSISQTRWTSHTVMHHLPGGHTLPYYHNATVPSYQPRENSSPDGRYRVGLYGNGSSTHNLMLMPANSNEGVILEYNLVGQIDHRWSPDNKWLAVIWSTPDGIHHAATYTLDPEQVAAAIAANNAEKLRHFMRNSSGFTTFWEWSPDSRFLLHRTSTNPMLVSWSTASKRTFELPIDGEVIERLSWTIEGDRFASLIASPNAARDVIVATPERILHRIRLEYAPVNTQFVWSPNSQTVAMFVMQAFPFWEIDLIDAASGKFTHVAQVSQRGDFISLPLAIWSQDGQHIFYAQERRAANGDVQQYDWVSYSLAQQQDQVIVAKVANRPYFPEEGRVRPEDVGQSRRAIFIWTEGDGTRRAALMDIDGQNRVDIFVGATDAGNPYWSPTGEYAALVWGTGKKTERVTRLTWLKHDASEVKTISSDLWDARDLRWLGDGRSLAFVAVRADEMGTNPRYSMEAVDLESGTVKVFASGYHWINLVTPGDGSGIDFWWQTEAQFGTSGFSADGTRRFHYAAPITDRTVSIAGTVSESDGWRLTSNAAPRLFISPNSDVAAIKIGPYAQESLFLVGAEGAWAKRIRKGLRGLGDPKWSPDGAQIAFTQATYSKQGVTLEIVTARGRDLYSIKDQDGLFRNLEWSRCAPNPEGH